MIVLKVLMTVVYLLLAIGVARGLPISKTDVASWLVCAAVWLWIK